MNIDSISEVYELFINGLGVGVLLSGLPFIIGYAINAIIKISQDSQ